MDIGLGSVLGAGISSLGGLVGGAIQYNTNKKLLKQQNQYNLEMSNLEWERNLDMWNRQNVYNSPVEQMRRLKEAGLNPNLMYGQGNVGNASGAPEFSAPRSEINRYNGDFGISQAANAVSNGINAYISLQDKLADIRNKDASTAKTNVDTSLRELQAIGQEKANARSEIELKYLDDIQDQTLRNMEQTNINMRTNNEYVDQQRLQFEAERPLKIQLLEQRLEQVKFLNELNPLKREHLKYTIANLGAQYQLRVEQITGQQLLNQGQHHLNSGYMRDNDLKDIDLLRKELEYHIREVLVNEGVNLDGKVGERIINSLIQSIEDDNTSLKEVTRAAALGATGLIQSIF